MTKNENPRNMMLVRAITELLRRTGLIRLVGAMITLFPHFTTNRLNISRPVKVPGFLPICLMSLLSALFFLSPGCEKSQDVDTFQDVDGNIYTTVKIGEQLWMKENLRTTRFSNGKSITHTTSMQPWCDLDKPGYCWYNNNQDSFGNDYGALYNWYTVDHGKLCPKGWHVPSDGDWSELVLYLGGLDVAGGKLKEKDTTHWYSPNEGADNSSGFTALPGGYRSGINGTYNKIGEHAYWWSSTPKSSECSWFRSLSHYHAHIDRSSSYNNYGLSVRCVRD